MSFKEIGNKFHPESLLNIHETKNLQYALTSSLSCCECHKRAANTELIALSTIAPPTDGA